MSDSKIDGSFGTPVVLEDFLHDSDLAEQRHHPSALSFQSLNVPPQRARLRKDLLSNVVPQLLLQRRVLPFSRGFLVGRSDEVGRLFERPLHQTLALPLPAHFRPPFPVFQVSELLTPHNTLLHLQVQRVGNVPSELPLLCGKDNRLGTDELRQ